MADESIEEELPSPADARLLEELRHAHGADPVPTGFIERSKGLLAWMGIDEELAELIATPEAEMAGTRGSTATTALSFRLGDGPTLLELTHEPPQLHGQLISGEADSAVLRRRDGTEVTTEVDLLGQFTFDDVGGGTVQLTVRTGNETTFTTQWFVV